MTDASRCCTRACLALLSTLCTPDVLAEQTVTADFPDKTAISVFYARSEFSDSYHVGIDKSFRNGLTGVVNFTQESDFADDLGQSRSYSLELIKNLGYTWTLAGVINRWNGADDATSDTVELEISHVFDYHRIGAFVGKHGYHLTGKRLSGQTLERDLDSNSAGVDIRIYPTDALALSLRYQRYSHDFNPESLNIEQRPSLLLILSPDTVGILGSLIDDSIKLDTNFYHERWLLGVQTAIYRGSVDELKTRSWTLYADMEVNSRVILSLEFGQQSTESEPSSSFSGIGARFSW